MQLVRTFSVTLHSDPDTARRQLLPCPLSVTPLGASMGLIQWVDHTMPLYGVYKAWQHRQLTDKAGKLLLGLQGLSTTYLAHHGLKSVLIITNVTHSCTRHQPQDCPSLSLHRQAYGQHGVSAHGTTLVDCLVLCVLGL